MGIFITTASLSEHCRLTGETSSAETYERLAEELAARLAGRDQGSVTIGAREYHVSAGRCVRVETTRRKRRVRPCVQLTLAPDVIAALKVIAERAGMSRSAYVERLIRRSAAGKRRTGTESTDEA